MLNCSIKQTIIELRSQGKSYAEIQAVTGLTKATISYHCNKVALGGRVDKKNPVDEHTQDAIKAYYVSHTLQETASHFGLAVSTIKCHVNKKREVLTPEERILRNYKRIRDRRQRLKQMGVDHLGGQCIKCGYNRSIWALQFHHRDKDTKTFTLSNYGNLSWEKFKQELEKCDLVCANCHAEVHHEEYLQITP